MMQQKPTPEKPLPKWQKTLLIGSVVVTIAYFATGPVAGFVYNTAGKVSYQTSIAPHVVRYDEKVPVHPILRRFFFLDKDGENVLTVDTPEGRLVAKIVDANHNGELDGNDSIEVWEKAVTEDGKTLEGIVRYLASGVIVDINGRRYHADSKVAANLDESAAPTGVIEAEISELVKGMVRYKWKQQIDRWNTYLKTDLPGIRAKMNEQQQR